LFRAIRGPRRADGREKAMRAPITALFLSIALAPPDARSLSEEQAKRHAELRGYGGTQHYRQ
jgi:hypothetical protein